MKRMVAFIIVVLILISLVGCTKQNLQFHIDGAVKIIILSGSTGRSAEITDEETISYITQNMNSLRFVKDKSSKFYDGFLYSLIWYDSDNKKMEGVTVMSENKISYNNYFYNNKEEGDGVLDIGYMEKLFPAVTQ